MEDSANTNAGLMRRIVQLETEKEELQRDIETLCMQQSGFSGSIDIVSRMQSRRTLRSSWENPLHKNHPELRQRTLKKTPSNIVQKQRRTSCIVQTREEQAVSQELEACKQKLALHAKENLNLQEELTEVHRAKGRVADAFKAAMDKNKDLEKEVKFYQSRMAGAFTERDKAVLEVERLHDAEKIVKKDFRELHRRLEETNAKCCEQDKSFKELQQSMEVSISELKRVQEVVEKFWQIRESAKENGDFNEEIRDKAQILLEDNDADWVYELVSDKKSCCRTLELALSQTKAQLDSAKAASTKLEEELSQEQSTSTKLEYELALSESASIKLKQELTFTKSQSTILREEVELTKAMADDFKFQLEGEHLARTDAEEKISIISDQLALKQYTLVRDVRQVQAQQITLKRMLSVFLEAEKGQVSLLEDSVRTVAEKVKSEELQQQEKRPNLEENGDSVLHGTPQKQKDLGVENEGASEGTGVTKEQNESGGYNVVNIAKDDSREILAQVLQEKVEALLLLSQQEERYYLEASTKSALESQVTELNQKLARVTGEKVKALMDLAEERQQIQELKERERELIKCLEQQRITSLSGVLVQASQIENKVSSLDGETSIVPALEDKPVVGAKQRFIASGGYLKGWLRGLDISAFKTASSGTSSNTGVAEVTHSNTTSNISVSRPTAEDEALQECVASIQRLAKSAHRLRMILIKVASESQGELEQRSIQSFIEVLESVKSEAKQLAVARGSSLPVSFQAPLENSPDNSYVELPSEERLEDDKLEVGVTSLQDLVSMIGTEITDSLLATAELQAHSLRSRLGSEVLLS